MDKTKVVTVRLDPRRLAFVDAEAAARRWSRSTVIQALIDSASGATDRQPEPAPRATAGQPLDHRPAGKSGRGATGVGRAPGLPPAGPGGASARTRDDHAPDPRPVRSEYGDEPNADLRFGSALKVWEARQ